MKLELYMQNINTGKIYDLSELAQEIKVTSQLEGEAGKLTTTLQRDPNNLLEIANGSIVSFIVDGTGFFYGYIFKIGTKETGDYEITCYDQLRYLKNSEVMKTDDTTASNIFVNICKTFGLKYKVKVATKYKPEGYVHTNKTLYKIIKRGMDLASVNDKKQYFIRDDFGTLIWSELSQEKTNIQLGDETILTEYNYEKEIDSDTYNQIKFYREKTSESSSKTTNSSSTSNNSTNNNSKKTREIWIVKDSNSIKKWGTLQLLKQADDDATTAEIKELAKNYLTLKNREKETLKFKGDGIVQLIAGRGIKFVLAREGIDKWMWIKSASHTFTKQIHTMELEVEI